MSDFESTKLLPRLASSPRLLNQYFKCTTGYESTDFNIEIQWAREGKKRLQSMENGPFFARSTNADEESDAHKMVT